MKRNIVVARGDGIGPEVMESALRILKEASADIITHEIEIGEKLYLKGHSSGIDDASWDAINEHKILFKAPITTPLGGGYKSLNVTFRKELGLYANVRPVCTYTPFVQSMHDKMNIVIIRENEEDLYAAVEYRVSSGVCTALKITTALGTEKIIRYAFEYAVANNRKKVTCITKNNILKITDGLFHNIFKSVAKEYPNIETDHMIVDIGMARIAAKPERFDVVVTSNLYGDIVSDIAAEVSGSVGLAGSANIGTEYSMFEAVHGSAPDIAGKNKANPSGLINAAVMMLGHIGQNDVSAKIKNAWLKTIEDGIHTGDIFNEQSSTKLVSTSEFTDAVIRNLGEVPKKLPRHTAEESKNVAKYNIKPTSIDGGKYSVEKKGRKIIGIDIFLSNVPSDKTIDDVGNTLSEMQKTFKSLFLKFISNRGLLVWPNNKKGVTSAEMLRCRFIFYDPQSVDMQDGQQKLIELQMRIIELGFEICGSNTLFQYDGVDGFSMAQNE